MPKKLFISDARMLTLMEFAVNEKLVNSDTDFMKAIDFPPTNISNVRAGRQGFTKTHIYKACRLTGASADYIFGFSNQLKRSPAKSAVEKLKEVLIELSSKKS